MKDDNKQSQFTDYGKYGKPLMFAPRIATEPIENLTWLGRLLRKLYYKIRDARMDTLLAMCEVSHKERERKID